ncbi:MAG: hypothetical protein K9G48_08575 [Reyranella sp.]|nr:hypothetical protein [Reyranella sp.]
MFPRIQDATIKTAENALRAAVAKGFDNQPVVVTDGKPRVDYHLVKPWGRIEFIRRPTMKDAVLWALQELVKRSPVGPGRNGHFRDRHMVLIDGNAVQGDIGGALNAVKAGQRVQIVNIQPYAKKLEGVASKKKRKIKGRRGASKQARGGIYRPVQRLIVQRYGRSLFVDFKMVKLELAGAQRRTKTGIISANYTYPALQFYIKA